MAEDERSTEELIKALLGERFEKVTLSGGVVGKTTHVVLGVGVILLAIVIRLSATNLWLDSALVAVGLAATLGAAWWIHRTHAFAEKNPLQAMLSGAQFVEYQRFTAEIKGLPHPANAPLVPSPNMPAVPSSDPQKQDRA